MDVTCSYTICHKNSPTRIWRQASSHSEMLYRQRCLSISKQIYQNVLVLYHLIIQNQHNKPLSQCMDFKLGQKDLKFSSKSQRMLQSPTRYLVFVNREKHICKIIFRRKRTKLRCCQLRVFKIIKKKRFVKKKTKKTTNFQLFYIFIKHFINQKKK